MNSTSNTLPATPAAKDDHILWNHSVKLVSMLYYWKLVDSYESILQVINIHQKYLQQETTSETPIWMPVYAKEKNMQLHIVSGKCAAVPVNQFEKMDALRQQFLKQI